jgi:hypothetical protein
MFDVLTTYAEAALFLKLVCFFPWLAGWFHNFELTQNREKTRNGLSFSNRDPDTNLSTPSFPSGVFWSFQS